VRSATRSINDPDPEAQIFVLRVPGPAAAAELEHVNAGTLTQHATLQDAFGRIAALASPEPHRPRRH
jgi:hypothetical protein